MKKILLVFDGSRFSEGAFEFVRQLNELAPVLVTGAFIPQSSYANLWSYASAAAASSGMAATIPLIEDEEAEEVVKNIERFENLCRKNGISYRVHKDFYEFVLPELKKESRFADIVLLGSEMFYHDLGSARLEFIRDAAHTAECPVLLVPEKFDFPVTNILAYNGSADSVYALKQFAYIFPELAGNKTLLVYAEDEEDKDFPKKQNIIELATQHYGDLEFYKLEIKPRKYFATWISEKKSAILVSGAFGRSDVSDWFRKSFITEIIEEHRLPIFIAHR